MTAELSYEDFRNKAMQKAAWTLVYEHRSAGRHLDRQDLLQEFWAWLLEPGKDGRTGDDKLREWLAPDARKFRRAVAELVAVGHRALKHHQVEDAEAPGADADDESSNVFEQWDARRARPTQSAGWPSRVEAAVAALGFPDRDILQMSAEGFNAAEIADVLELQPSAVRQRRKRALDRLREDLAA